jgi:xanthine dehydrogenase accessory factor
MARMPGDDVDELIEAVINWRSVGFNAVLATVIETWGSAPRRVGAHLAVRNDGVFVGSVSGGCVESDVIRAALELPVQGGVKRLDYGVVDEQAWEVGLACGGRVSVLIQTIDDHHFPPALLHRLLGARRGGESVTITTDIVSGRSREGRTGAEGQFVNQYQLPVRIALIGAVHIAQVLAPMARLAGYSPTVIDPRAAFAAPNRFPDTPVDPRWPDEALAEWRPDSASAILTLTHDPKIDDPALRSALRTSAFYVGALGSRRTHTARLERLALEGFNEDALARIHGPAGLRIGAANPAEIAVSVLAEVTAVWRGTA